MHCFCHYKSCEPNADSVSFLLAWGSSSLQFKILKKNVKTLIVSKLRLSCCQEFFLMQTLAVQSLILKPFTHIRQWFPRVISTWQVYVVVHVEICNKSLHIFPSNLSHRRPSGSMEDWCGEMFFDVRGCTPEEPSRPVSSVRRGGESWTQEVMASIKNVSRCLVSPQRSPTLLSQLPPFPPPPTWHPPKWPLSVYIHT